MTVQPIKFGSSFLSRFVDNFSGFVRFQKVIVEDDALDITVSDP